MTREEILTKLNDVKPSKKWTNVEIEFNVYFEEEPTESVIYDYNIENLDTAEGKDQLAKWAELAFISIKLSRISIKSIKILDEADTLDKLYEKQGIKWMSCDDIDTGDRILFLSDEYDHGYKSSYIGYVRRINKEEKMVDVDYFVGLKNKYKIVPYSDLILKYDASGDVDKDDLWSDIEYDIETYFKEGAGPEFDLIELENRYKRRHKK